MDHASTMRATYERINSGDVAGFGDLLADNFVEHDFEPQRGGPDLPPNKDGTLSFFRVLLSAFPDLHMAVEDLLVSGDKTVARVRATGTHQGEFVGVSPTGNRVDVELIDIMRFDDADLVCDHWGVGDMLSLMQQIGAVAMGPPE